MARIAGVDLPKEKRIEIALTYIFGIGRTTSNEIINKAKIDPDKKVFDLDAQEVNVLRKVIENDYKVEGDLNREIAMNINRLKEIKCYKGIRHRKGLPLNGQRTKTNARTRKGPKRTVGRKKKK